MFNIWQRFGDELRPSFRAYTRRKVVDWWMARWLALRVICVLFDPVLEPDPEKTRSTEIVPDQDEEEQAISHVSEAELALTSKS